MVNYDGNPDSGAKSTARSKANKDPDSDTKSTARPKANYDRDPKSGTKANYDRPRELHQVDCQIKGKL